MVEPDLVDGGEVIRKTPIKYSPVAEKTALTAVILLLVGPG